MKKKIEENTVLFYNGQSDKNNAGFTKICEYVAYDEMVICLSPDRKTNEHSYFKKAGLGIPSWLNQQLEYTEKLSRLEPYYDKILKIR